jgi:hypothetical protein
VIIKSSFSINYKEDPIRYLELEEYESSANDCLLYIGWPPHESIVEESRHPKYLFASEEQFNMAYKFNDPFMTDKYVPYVEKIFTVCDANLTKRRKRINSFFPFNKKYIPENKNKIYDVIYTGYANVKHMKEILNTILKFNYRHVSFEKQIGTETNLNSTYLEKLNLVSQSKCSIVHNLLDCNTPQLKSRAFEAAFSKSLMLVLKDNYNVIEEYFVPNQDFLYFENHKELEKIIKEVLSNYQDYQHVIENAYTKSINNYTTEKFVEKYIGFKQ